MPPGLLLDEHIGAAVARGLRARERDVLAVFERAELRGVADAALWSFSLDERRAIVTYDKAGFLPLVSESLRQGAVPGLVLVSYRSIPPGAHGELVRALDRLLDGQQGDLLEPPVHWLAPPP